MKLIKLFVLVSLVLCVAVSAWAGPVLDRVLEKGEIVVGTSGAQPPLNMKTKSGDIIGMEADIALHIARSIGVEVQMVTMPFKELIPALLEGKIDIIMSGMTMTPERNTKMFFVGPYAVTGKSILTKLEKVEALDEAEEINTADVRLAALGNSTSQVFVENVIPQAQLTLLDDLNAGVQMVLNDEVDALVADFPVCAVNAVRHKDEGLISTQTPFTYEPLGIAVSESDPLLANVLTNILNALEGNGDLVALSYHWFQEDDWINELPDTGEVA